MVSRDELISVLQQVADGEENVQDRSADLKAAQKRADATTGLTEAAKRDFDNADAKYKVALEEEEGEEEEEAPAKGGPPKEKIEAANNELLQEEQIAEAIGEARTKLNEAAVVAVECHEKIRETKESIQTLADELDPAPADPEKPAVGARNGNGIRAAMRNAAERLRDHSGELEAALATHGTRLEEVRNALQKVEELHGLAAIRALMEQLVRSGADKVKAGKKTKKVATLRTARDKAYRAWRNAPEIESSANDDLIAKQGARDRAQGALDDANAARDVAEQDIIERIDVFEEIKGRVKVELIFFDKNFLRDCPRKVMVKWIVKALDWTEFGRETAYVPTGGRAGDFEVEAHLAIKPDREEAEADEEADAYEEETEAYEEEVGV